MNRYLILDYETRSEADLRKTGAWEYSVHPSTEVLCVAWRYGTKGELKNQKTKVWSPLLHGKEAPRELIKALNDSFRNMAHNAYFEQCITLNVLLKKYTGMNATMYTLGPERWGCTASMAAVLAFPRNLEGACIAIGLEAQKDMQGHRIMMKMCKPRRATKHDDSKWHESPEDLQRLIDYCVADIEAEVELFLKLPPLSPFERRVWIHNQRMNLRGFRVDRPLVKKILKLIAEETKSLNTETRKITKGKVQSATQRNAVLAYLKKTGTSIKDLKAKTVEDALASGMVSGDAKRLLEIRQAISKTSTAKYLAMWQRSQYDGRIRDHLLYAAASTLREGGMGVQPQNFPRGIQGLSAVEAAEFIKNNDLEMIRLFCDPMTLFASALRGMIIADEGTTFHCADYAAIETHVLFWFANHREGLKALFEKRDLYTEMASFIYRIAIAKIGKDSRERFVGKQVILGCGYMMGGPKFRANCKILGVDIDEKTAIHAVKTYRKVHAPVVKLWGNIERAAIAAVKSKGKRFTINHTSWQVLDDILWCELPGGFKLSYPSPKLEKRMMPWKEKKEVLTYMAVNSTTRKWNRETTYGGKLCENIVQSCSRNLLVTASLELTDAGYTSILHVHDEIVSQRKIGKGDQEQFEKIMARVPKWASGCPVRVEGWMGDRYRK